MYDFDADDQLTLEPGMERNAAGGGAYRVAPSVQLARYLTLGTNSGTYYVSKPVLDKANVENIDKMLDEDPRAAIDMVVEYSTSGRTPSNDPSLYVLARAVSRKTSRTVRSRRTGNLVQLSEPSEACRLALAALPRVARTGTDLFHFMRFLRETRMRGMGNGFMRELARWYNDRPVAELGYQVIKYPSRDGVSHRDVYNLTHPARWVKPDAARRVVFDFIVKGTLPEPAVLETLGLPQLAAYQRMLASDVTPSAVARLVSDYELPMLAVPTHLRTAEVYEAELQHSGLTWLLRNLGNLSKHGVLVAERPDVVDVVCRRLEDDAALRRQRVHPLAVFKALLTYRDGRGLKGSGTWPVVPDVVDTLNRVLYRSFRSVEPSNRRLALCIDVSGSMQGSSLGTFPGATLHECAAVMALAIANSERYWTMLAFDEQAYPLQISPAQRIEDVLRMLDRWGGGTDLAAGIRYAREHRIPVDAFVLLTDNETWAGDRYAYADTESNGELQLYREEIGLDAKVINVAMTATGHSVTPRVIRMSWSALASTPTCRRSSPRLWRLNRRTRDAGLGNRRLLLRGRDRTSEGYLCKDRQSVGAGHFRASALNARSRIVSRAAKFVRQPAPLAGQSLTARPFNLVHLNRSIHGVAVPSVGLATLGTALRYLSPFAIFPFFLCSIVGKKAMVPLVAKTARKSAASAGSDSGCDTARDSGRDGCSG
jgi:60 kDa SS-A/Ro ribonucleoprotein